MYSITSWVVCKVRVRADFGRPATNDRSRGFTKVTEQSQFLDDLGWDVIKVETVKPDLLKEVSESAARNLAVWRKPFLIGPSSHSAHRFHCASAIR